MIASYQRVALYVFFDAIERDMVARIRMLCPAANEEVLTVEEKAKALSRLQNRTNTITDDDYDLLHGLDIGDKFAVLLRLKDRMDLSAREYFKGKQNSFEKAIPVRNATMHARPLTTEEYALGFSLANDFLSQPSYWPSLCQTYREFNEDPRQFVAKCLAFVDADIKAEALNNLPIPDYDDTGFLPRPALEKELKKKILGRHPVVTVLGDGGNGKTALTLQTLYGLIESNEHDFDAIVWVSAKSTKLTVGEISRIEGAITDSLGLFEDVADLFEPGDDTALDRVKRLLENNKILLVIDNLETVLDDEIRDFASDVPGESKILFTSRIPLGSDLSVVVHGFTDEEAMAYLQKLIDAYSITQLKNEKHRNLARYTKALGNKPLLIKWLAWGVQSGLSPEKIVSNPDMAISFCMENIFDRLSNDANKILASMAVVTTAVSPAILQYITEEGADAIESGLAELLRYAIIESVKNNDYERLFQIKPFARSYLSRIQKISHEDSDSILSKFKKIDGTFQFARSETIRNRYDPKTYTVRSRSEALAKLKLVQASNSILNDRFKEAEDIISQLKITNSEYFEVFRIDAFLAFKQGDVARAFESYETATDLGKNQPQIYFFFGGFIMRTSRDFTKAGEYFNAALELDPHSPVLLTEAARCQLYDHKYEDAQKLLDRVDLNSIKRFKDLIMFNDLQIQIFTRQAENLINEGNQPKLLQIMKKLQTFIEKIDMSSIDRTMIGHLKKAEYLLTRVSSSERASLIQLENFLRLISIPDEEKFKINPANPARTKLGQLKKAGRKDGYGFLQDTHGGETFIARATTDESTWSHLINGGKVEFEVHQDNETGKTNAENVRKVNVGFLE